MTNYLRFITIEWYSAITRFAGNDPPNEIIFPHLCMTLLENFWNVLFQVSFSDRLRSDYL